MDRDNLEHRKQEPGLIDLRSDTVTRPTPEMRQAMAEAEVGDDVYGEDPTVNRLEQRAAEILGKEAALFVPSGTMGNVIAIKLHTRHGQEVICEARSHVFDWELAMMAWFAGCLARPIPGEHGILTWEKIRPHVREPGPHWAPTGLIVIENTHNMAGGTVYPPEITREICEGAHELGIKVHLDGARIFNAATYLQKPVAELVRPFDTVMFCLSKGLGAPVGSMLVGSAEEIATGRLLRKRLGGGMRQAGVLAAAGLIALERMPHRLEQDHRNAALLAEGIQAIEGLKIVHLVQTNIVIFDVAALKVTASDFVARLRQRGVLMGAVGPTYVRAVTHFDVSTEGCLEAVKAIEEVVAELRKRRTVVVTNT